MACPILDEQTEIMTPYYHDDLITLYNSDNREVLASLPDESIDCTITDPPYGIGFLSGHTTIPFDEIAEDDTPTFDILPELFRVHKNNTALYLFTRWDVQQQWIDAVNSSGFEVKNVIVWSKGGGGGMGDLEGNWSNDYESIIYAVKGRHIINVRHRTVINADRVSPGNMFHPTQKPREVWYQMLEVSTKRGDLVLDPYAGSCSSLKAASAMGRRIIGCELVEKYCKKAVTTFGERMLFEI